MLKEIGFAGVYYLTDSKALTAEKRNTMLAALVENHAHMGASTLTQAGQCASCRPRTSRQACSGEGRII